MGGHGTVEGFVQRKNAPARGLRAARCDCRRLSAVPGRTAGPFRAAAAPLIFVAALSGCEGGESVLGTAVAAEELTAPPALEAKPVANFATRAAPLPLATAVVESKPAPPAEDAAAEAPRVYSKTRFVWIRERPDWGSGWLGYLWHGGSARLKTGKPVFARGCQVWYEIEPRGYVCVDGRRATLDASDPGYREVSRHMGDYDSPTPHRYAMSLGTPRYSVLPSVEDQRVREEDYTFHQREIAAVRAGTPARELLSGVDLTPAPLDAVTFAALPVDVQMHKVALKRDSAMAYFAEYRHGDRAFLLTADLAWVPKDRVRPYPPIAFRGLTLGAGKDARLPVAFFRIKDRPGFRRLPDGDFVPVAAGFKRLEWVPLTGVKVTARDATYVETTRAGLWVREDDAVIPTPPGRTPWGDPMSVPPPSSGVRRTWIEVDVFGGWLIAYEENTPVFTTLISAGRGGVASPAEEAWRTSSTPLGNFVVTGKFLTATMDGPTDVTHADVPWVQNFSGPHSIHTAYWHDAWGERVSSGCVNVSPLDARWLFDFSAPKVPRGWHSARADVGNEPATIVVVHR